MGKKRQKKSNYKGEVNMKYRNLHILLEKIMNK